MKRILFIMLSLYNGGAEKSLVNLLNELPADRYEIDLLLFKPEGMFMRQVPPYVRILETPDVLKRLFGPIKKSGKYMVPKFVQTIHTALAEKQYKRRKAHRWNHFYTKHIDALPQHYDVAIGYTSNEVMYYLNEKVDADRKLVWVHNDYIAAGYAADYDYPHLRNMDAIVTISQSCQAILQKVFPDLADRVYDIPNITSSKVVCNRANADTPKEYADNEFTILSIGRLDDQKGFDMAIDAAEILKRKGLKFSWFIMGSGVLEKNLRAQIEMLDVSDRIYLIGTRENPYPYIKNCDLLVQSSRFEGKSVVLDEAKILAVPILATNYPTVADQIVDGAEGVVVPMTPKSIADGIEELMNDKERRNAIHSYLSAREYGNQSEVEKYIKVIDGK